jgi:ABC-type phosphate transport system substrate-binding protein
MYTDGKPTGPVQAYFEFGLGGEGQSLVGEVGYIPLPPEDRAAMLAKVRA